MVKTLGTIERPELVTARSSMARRMWLAISTGCTAERRCLAKVPCTARSSPASRRSNSPIGAPPPQGSGRQRSRKTIRRGWAIPERRGPYRGRMNDAVQVIVPRQVPLGGPRSMTVRRTLPARERSFVGAWCFVDHYGPDDVSATGGMDVAPHPHCGLATVSWLFSGEVEHRDSLGTVALVRPGEVNLMTAGRGISHSEVSTPATTVLHGAQLWVVLPTALAGVEPRFEHHVPPVLEVEEGVSAQVFVGSLWGSTSPVAVETPLVGAEVVLAAGASVVLPVPDGFEVAVLGDRGAVTLGGVEIARGALGVLGAGRHPGGVTVSAGAEGARVLVLGG